MKLKALPLKIAAGIADAVCTVLFGRIAFLAGRRLLSGELLKVVRRRYDEAISERSFFAYKEWELFAAETVMDYLVTSQNSLSDVMSFEEQIKWLRDSYVSYCTQSSVQLLFGALKYLEYYSGAATTKLSPKAAIIDHHDNLVVMRDMLSQVFTEEQLALGS